MERVIAESKEDTGAPLMQACAETTLLRGDRPEEFLVDLPVPCIKAAVADHFEMLFGDMADEAFDEIHGRDSLLHISPIFMAVIMEGDKVTVIAVNTGSGDDRAAKIAADIFNDRFRAADIRLCINIEAMLVIRVTAGLDFFKRRANLRFHFIKKSGAESIAEESIVEMAHMTPEAVVTVTAFRNKTVDMRIPFEVPAKSMEDHDKAGSKIFGFIQLEKHTGDDTGNGMEEAVKQGAVIEEKRAEIFVNGEDAVTVGHAD